MLRLILLVTFAGSASCAATSCEKAPERYRLQFDPSELAISFIGQTGVVALNFVCEDYQPDIFDPLNGSYYYGSNLTAAVDCEYYLTFTLEVSEGKHVVEINCSRLQFETPFTSSSFAFAVTSENIGRARLSWKVERIRECYEVCKNDNYRCKAANFTNADNLSSGYYIVNAVNKPTGIHKLFVVILLILVSMNNINMGCHLCLDVIKDVLKRPVAPIIGLGCQFLFMPLASYGFGKLIFDDYECRLGLFVLGCSPGGTISNFWTLMFKGDLDLSVTMTFVSTIASIGMMPLWIFTLGSTIFNDGVLQVPYLTLVLSLLGLTVPLCLGFLIQKYRPSWAEKSRMISRPFTIICLIAAVSLGIYSYRHIVYLVGWKVVAAAVSVAWSGYAFGAIFGCMARLTKQQIIAVSIETALQNASVAFVLLQLTLPQPDADLTVVPVVAQLVVTAAPLWMFLGGCFINKRIEKRRQRKREATDLDLWVRNHRKEDSSQLVSSV